MKKIILLALSATLFLNGCHKNIAVHSMGDEQMNSYQIKAEMAQVERDIQEINSKTGLSGRNLGLFLVFWPGIIINEQVGSYALSNAQQRLKVLDHLYAKKVAEENALKTKARAQAKAEAEIEAKQEAKDVA